MILAVLSALAEPTRLEAMRLLGKRFLPPTFRLSS